MFFASFKVERIELQFKKQIKNLILNIGKKNYGRYIKNEQIFVLFVKFL